MKLKYVPTFESFLNEAKVELGNIDSSSMDDKWKIEQVNDILKKAEGKTCTFLDIISLAGHQGDRRGDIETSTKDVPDSVLKNIKCKIVKVEVEGSYANLVHSVGYTFDTAPYDGYRYWTKEGVADLTGNIAKYKQNTAKDENGKPNGAGVKFKDFPSIYPDFDAEDFADGGYEPGKMVGQGTFQINYPYKPNSKENTTTFSRFADIFGLGDITPNFPDAKGAVTDYDNIDYWEKLAVNCYQFVRGSMAKMVSFLTAEDIRLHGKNHTRGAGFVVCNKKDLKKIHADLLDGFEGKKPRLNNIPVIGIDTEAEEGGANIDSPIYQKKWAAVCKFLGARDTSDLVCVNILMRLGYKNAADQSFSEEEIEYARDQYNGFRGWSSSKVPLGIAPLVKRIRVKKYAGDKLV